MRFTAFNLKRMVTVAAAMWLIAAFLITSGFSFITLQSDLQTLDIKAPKLPFSDIKGHWAEAGIMEMYAGGVMKGYRDSTFRPKQPVTKLEAIIALDHLLGYKPDQDIDSLQYLGDLFEIPKWAYGYVGVALKNNLLFYGELGSLSHKQPLSRQDAAILAVRALKLSRQVRHAKDVEIPFTDMEQVDSVNKIYVKLACDMKIMSGFPDGKFQPFTPVSRAELAVILSKISQQRPQKGEISGRIKDVEAADNRITLFNNDGAEIKLNLPEALLIYADDKPVSLDKLAQGSYIKVINKNPEFNVLISRSMERAEGAPVFMKVLNSSMIPEDLIQWVEVNKAFPNYLTKISNGKIYFLVTSGEKMTGGYAIDISNISSTIDSEGKVNYLVTVLLSEPQEDAIVNQVVSYPFSIVEIDLPTLPLGSVQFVDADNVNLAENNFD